MQRDATSGGIRMAEPALQLRADPRPICPQFRPSRKATLYPVCGHCAPLRRPGFFAVPRIDEYRNYCTRSAFVECPWFRGVDAAQANASGTP
jgi:hypothetical protein